MKSFLNLAFFSPICLLAAFQKNRWVKVRKSRVLSIWNYDVNSFTLWTWESLNYFLNHRFSVSESPMSFRRSFELLPTELNNISEIGCQKTKAKCLDDKKCELVGTILRYYWVNFKLEFSVRFLQSVFQNGIKRKPK